MKCFHVFTWNSDAWGYGAGTTSLYQSHPWVLAVLPTGETLGVLADTTRKCEIAQTFLRDKKIPSDVIWMDIDYMDGFRCFTFDKESFPDPSALTKHLHDNGFKAIWMLDPGIKQDEGYSVYDSGSKNDVWIRGADGKPFVGDVWPGPCVFPDYTNSEARSWWANLVKDFISNGVDGIWNDMNEPAVFKVVTKTMPENNIHRGDDELGGVQNHSHYHNGLSGQPLSGPDIGGFAGNATPRLFGRWMGVGAMFPFCRGHSAAGTDDHEPWSFGEECEEVCRAALKRRYQLLPHFYTLFYIAHTTGAPVAAPIFFAGTVGDLPTLYLQGGSIITLGPPHLHVGESSLSDDLTLLVSLDENGKAIGVLFEDDGDGYGYTKGSYLITHYIAARQSSIVTVKVLKTEGEWQRPNRRIHVQLLLGGENAKLIPEKEMLPGHKGMELSKEPVELNNGDWKLNIVPWIGGRILSMTHVPSGVQWLHSTIDINGYEEYIDTEYRSAGGTEEYNIIERDLEHAGEEESLILEGDVGGGLVLRRKITIPKHNPKVFRIASSIEARSVGAGSDGFSRLVCLRVHPTFTLIHPTESFISFTSIDGTRNEVWPDSGEHLYEGNNLPNGEWMLVDKSLNVQLVNRYSELMAKEQTGGDDRRWTRRRSE
ncbi:unnamed protein product [Microthlaspi erraticum]|uniref:Uncharacterized protein n=1 Tax=Microthlaspi erraticum TaxID=1685480 RepID=A0A6D2ISX2_9BRAS|nr:unnamed protein product [Microthlaspi erraticum]